MPIMQWDDSLVLNMPEMDAQHKKLVDMLNELYDSAKAGTAKTKLGKLLADLTDYGVYHFDEEELFMLRSGCLGVAQHKVKHREFIEKIRDFQSQYDQGRVMLSMDIMTFLKDWLVTHIKGVDKKTYGK